MKFRAWGWVRRCWMAEPPPAAVLEAFRLNGHAGGPVRRSGRRWFRVGNVMLKRTTLPEETEWSAGVLAKIASAAVQVLRVRRGHTADGASMGGSRRRFSPGAHN